MSEILGRLRAKYPQYDDIPDAELAFRVTEKYPEYKDTDLLKDAMPARAEAFGEIKAPTSKTRQLWDETKQHAGNLRGTQVSETGEVLETIGETTKRQLSGVGGLLGMPFRAIGQYGGAVAEPVLRSALGDKEGLRQTEALENTLEWAPQVVQGARGAMQVGATLSGGRHAVDPAKGGKPRIQGPKPVETPTTERAPVWTEEAHAPSAPEFDPLPPGSPLRPVEPLPKTTPFDAPAAPAAEPGPKLGALFGGMPKVAPGTQMAIRAGVGAAVGQDQGDDMIDKIRYGAMGAAVGAVLDPRLARGGLTAYRAAHAATPAIGGTSAAQGVAKWKAKTNAFFTPKDIARGLPTAENLVRDAWAADDVTNLLNQEFAANLDTAMKPVLKNPRDAGRILRFLDGGNIQLNPAEAQIASEIQQAYGQMSQASGVPLAPKLSDTFKALRDPNRGWGYALYDVVNDARNVAKKVSIDGGTMPNGTVVGGLGKRAVAHLKQMTKEGLPKEVIAYYTDYVNDLTKGPTMSKYQALSPQWAARIKNVEFIRTIGLNVGSVVSNTLGQMNTFAKTSLGSFGHAYYDLFTNPQLIKMARDSGLISDILQKADIETFASPTKFDAMLKKGSEVTGKLFAKMEEINRLHAFAAGYRDAIKQGKTGLAARDAAVALVNDTQFRFGMENAPKWMRGGNPTLSVVGQYKAYQIQQTLFLKNMLLHDPKAMAKWIMGTVAIAGPDAITGHAIGDELRKVASNVFGGDPRDFKFRGALGEIGIALGQQIGLGSFPIENISSISFFLPGPALSHILDIASLVARRKLNLTDITRGEGGKPLSPDEWARRLATSVSVQADRVRQAARVLQADKEMQESQTFGEAMGVTPATGGASRPKGTAEFMSTLTGVRKTETAEYGQARQEAGQRIERWNELVKKKAEAHAAGLYDEVDKLNKQGLAEFGKRPIIHGTNVKNAKIRQRTPALERQLRAAPKPIRSQIRKEVQD